MTFARASHRGNRTPRPRTTGPDLRVHVEAEPVLRTLLGCITVLVAASTVTRLLYVSGPDFPFRDGISYLLWVDSEQSLPTVFSVVLLAGCALVLGMSTAAIRREGRPDVGRWAGLTAIFVGLALDEWLSLHEELIDPMRSALDAGGIFYFTWIIPAAVAVVLIGAYYVPFLLRLPVETARLIVVAGALFVGGALGVEMLGGWLTENQGTDTVTYVLVTTVEETLEMVGAALFLYALLRHLRDHLGGARLQLEV